MSPARLLLFAGAICTSQVATAGELEGPGRFCGYSPIIDLLPGERITTLKGGVHAGTFHWKGTFGTLEVTGIGWASEPMGEKLAMPTGTGQVIFSQRRESGKFVIAIWSGRQGAAYFRSDRPLTKRALSAIDRVDLFQEGEDPTGCNLRTTFSWE